jgi:hypothetical protein
VSEKDNILYTRSDIQGRKLVRGKVLKVKENSFFITNGTYTWELHLRDDIILYKK